MSEKKDTRRDFDEDTQEDFKTWCKKKGIKITDTDKIKKAEDLIKRIEKNFDKIRTNLDILEEMLKEDAAYTFNNFIGNVSLLLCLWAITMFFIDEGYYHRFLYNCSATIVCAMILGHSRFFRREIKFTQNRPQ
jgi:hypothetical protein